MTLCDVMRRHLTLFDFYVVLDGDMWCYGCYVVLCGKIWRYVVLCGVLWRWLALFCVIRRKAAFLWRYVAV